MQMYEPYVQNTDKWIAYYAQGIRSKQRDKLPDAETSAPPNAGSLSELGHMSVTRVEPKGPLPVIPKAGATVPLIAVTPSESSVQQATFDAMRTAVSTPYVNSSGRGRAGGTGRGRGTRKQSAKSQRPSTASKKQSKKRSKKQLFGTPQDIFKSATAKKRQNAASKKKKNGSAK